MSESTDRGVQVMSTRLLQGWTMLADECRLGSCAHPLLEHKRRCGAFLACFRCRAHGLPVRIAASSSVRTATHRTSACATVAWCPRRAMMTPQQRVSSLLPASTQTPTPRPLRRASDVRLTPRAPTWARCCCAAGQCSRRSVRAATHR